MHVMAAEAGNPVVIHYALHEIIAMHAVLVPRAIGKVSERKLAGSVVFELPIVLQVLANYEAHRPVIVFAFDGLFSVLPCE